MMKAFYYPYLQKLNDALALSITNATMEGYDRVKVLIDGIEYVLIWDDIDDKQIDDLLVTGLRIEKHDG